MIKMLVGVLVGWIAWSDSGRAIVQSVSNTINEAIKKVEDTEDETHP